MDLDNLAKSISALTNHAVVQRLSRLLLDWEQHHRTLLYILLALAVGFVIGRYRASRAYRASAFQNRSEELLSRVALTNFGPPDYHLMNHVTLQMKDGTTQVDHILVSRFGVFVICRPVPDVDSCRKPAVQIVDSRLLRKEFALHLWILNGH